MVEVTLQNPNDASAPVLGARILGDVRLRSDKLATIIIDRSDPAADVSVTLQARGDGGNWVDAHNFTQAKTLVDNIGIGREFEYRLVLNSIDSGSVTVFLGG